MSDAEPLAAPPGDGDADTGGPVARRRRSWPGAALRALVVVAASAVAYASVIPVRTAIATRIDDLVPATNGTTDFPGKASQVGPHPVSSAGVKSLAAAAKAHPDQTGLVAAEWTTPGGSNDGLVDFAFLTPSPTTAATVADELKSQALSAGAYTRAGLAKSTTFDPGVGGTGALFTPTSGVTPSPPTIGVAEFSVGRVVGFVEVARTTGSPQADVVTAAKAEADHLRAVLGDFTLTPTRYPVLASSLWAAGTVAAAVLVGGGPVLRRRRRARREAARLAEEERLIRVGGATIVRTRRS